MPKRKRCIMIDFMKPIYVVSNIMLLTGLTACDSTDDVNVAEAIQSQTDSVAPEDVSASEVTQTPIEIVVPEKPESSENPALEPSSFDTYEDYITYIASIPRFEPYYKTVFAFESLEGSVSSVPLKEVKAMFNELKTFSDYIVVSEYPLYYRGYYEGDTSFVDGYEQYQTADVDRRGSNPINVVGRDWGWQ